MVPVNRYCTPSSRPISSGGLVVCRYSLELVRAMTCSAGSAESLPRISFVIPSAKYAFAVSPSVSNGNTARPTGPAAVAAGTRSSCLRHAKRAPAPTSNPNTSTSAPLGTRRCGRAGDGAERTSLGRLERACELERGAEAVRGHRRERALEHHVHRLGHGRPRPADRWRLAAHHLGDR